MRVQRAENRGEKGGATCAVTRGDGVKLGKNRRGVLR
jgi:hypothetical protein